MNFLLDRWYYAYGTNGTLYAGELKICDTIELPWMKNLKNRSCIPEGRYRLTIYPSYKFGMCVMINDVPGRSGILFHPANHAMTELQGCVAPVTSTTKVGEGINSRLATQRFFDLVQKAINRGEDCYLTIEQAMGH